MTIGRGLLMTLMVAGCGWIAHAQPKPTDPPRASAVKLPDGTIVFVTKNPDDPDPLVDGVVLSAADYQALVERAEAAAPGEVKPVPASKTSLRARIESRGDRTIAALTVTFAYRTTKPKAAIALGCERAVAVGAKAGNGKLPLLTAAADGFVVLAESPGDHTLTLELEVPVTARGTNGEVGFELGLPRAAISTFTLAHPPSGLKKVSVGTRTGDPSTAVKFTAITADSLAAEPLPLGPTDTLEVLWEPPGATGPADLAVDVDVVVRADEVQVETVAKLKLQGAATEWQVVLPPDAELTVERTVEIPTLRPSAPEVVKPTDMTNPVWVIRTPPEPGGGYWLATVTTRQVRPKPADSGAERSRHPIGPFFVTGAKHVGRLRVYAPPTLRVGFRTAPELRRQDLPANADEDLTAAFTHSGGGTKPVTWAELDIRPIPNTVRVRPQHKLRQATGVWRLETVVRVVPPSRGETDQVEIEFPPGWRGIEFAPTELVEPELVTGDDDTGRTVVVPFSTPQRTAFDFTFTAAYPYPPTGRELAIPLPRIAQADERETKVTATVADGWAVSGTGYGWEDGRPAGTGDPLKASGRPASATTVTGEFDRGLSRVDLRWQPHRAELGCEMRAEVTATLRQLIVSQEFQFRPTEGDVRPVRLRAAGDLIGFRTTPRLDPVAAGEWELKPPSDTGKEYTLTVQFAVQLQAAPGSPTEPVPVPLLWPQGTRTDATVRVWSGGRQTVGVVGRWRELLPEISPDSDSLPAFTLAASGDEPLALQLADDADTAVVIDRTLIQVVMTDTGGAAVRGRFLLRRWPAGGVEVDVPSTADILVNGFRVEPVWQGDIARVPISNTRTTGPVVLDVRYTTPIGGGRFDRVIIPPVVRGALYRAPPRWVVNTGWHVPLLPTAELQGERWGWRGYGFGPVGSDSPDQLDSWLRDGTRPQADVPVYDPPGELVTTRQPTLAGLPLVLIPTPAWIPGVAFIAFATVIGLSRLRPAILGPALAGVAAVAAVLTFVIPQPAAELAAAAQPGVAAAAAVLAGRFVILRFWWRFGRTPTFRNSFPTEYENQVESAVNLGGTPRRPAGSSDPIRVVGS